MSTWWRGGATLLLVVTVMLALTSSASSAGQYSVDKFQDPFGHHYVIFGYAMTTPASDYDTAITKSICECRNRCLVMPACRSVSAVPITAGVGVECRTSAQPTDPLDFSLRPPLHPLAHAVHFLRTVAEAWGDVEEDGNEYTISDDYRYCPDGRMAVATTEREFGILKKYVDLHTDGAGLHLYLRRLGLNKPLVWGTGTGAVLHSATEMATTAMVKDIISPWSLFFLKKAGTGVYVLQGFNKGEHAPKQTLCQLANTLNLQ